MSQFFNEPVVREAHNSSGNPALIADLWMPQSEALFDIRVIDTDTQSYSNRSPSEVHVHVLLTAEGEKKRKYHQACSERRDPCAYLLME